MVSVIVPMYNVEKYIVDCIYSLEKQEFKDFELIVVDDGSKDNSFCVAEAYLKKTNLTWQIISQENAGVSAARNTGIEASSGEYIVFLDADDMLHPDCLLKHVENLTVLGADVSICGRKELCESTSKYLDEIPDFLPEIFTQQETLKDMLYGKIKVGIPSVMCKRETLGDIRFAEGVAYGEDLEVLWKLISRAKKVAIIKTQLYGYRIHPTSAMGKMSPKRLDGMKLLEKLELYFDENVPNFAPLFRRSGVARWVWATMWQAAVAAKNYKDFVGIMRPYVVKEKIRKLVNYPEFKVRWSSVLYLCCPFLYYCLVRMIRRKMRNVT